MIIKESNNLNNNNNNKEDNSMFFGVISSLKLFKDKYLFAGIGNFITIYNIEGNEKLENKIKVFTSEKISKINIYQFSNNNYILILSGETKIKYSFFTEENINIQLNSISTKSNDYIMNHILYTNSDNEDIKQYLIIGFINNYIEIYLFNKNEKKFGFIKYIFSSVKCIVYSMAFDLYKTNTSRKDNYDSVLIASGTVFRKVIIWKILFSKDKNEFFKDDNDCLTLSGHKGVIFSVHFYSNNTLCSTSDDRITKYWKFDLKNQTFDCDDYSGHSSRVWDSKIFEPQNILVSVSEDATAFVYDLITKKCIGKLINGHEGWNIRSVEINKDYIWTGGEDGRLLKWKYSKLNNEINIKNDKSEKNNEEISYEIKNEGKQYELACIKQKQKNFKSSIRVVKFLNENYIIICTNHGQILGYNIKDKKVDLIFYADKEARVINSLDIINEYNILIAGLNDGNIILLYFDNYDCIKSSLIKLFKERVTFISHKIIDNNKELFILISTESSKIKICLIKDINQMSIINTLENNNSFLFFSSPLCSQINCFEIKKIENNNQNKDKNRYLLFLGDYEGRIYFTQLKKISEHIFLFCNLLKYIPIFKKSIITSIIYSLTQKTLYVHSRNNKIKKYIITNEYSSSSFSLKEIESQTYKGITSYEKVLYKDINAFDEEKYYIIGHDGRDLIIYDISQNKIIHKNDVKGVNKPLDLYLDFQNNKIYYISCQSNIAKLFTIKINSNNEIIEENKNGNLLIVKSYCLPVNGRVIHDINICSLKNNKYLVFSAGEDTKIKFYYINSIEGIFEIGKSENSENSIIYLGDFNMHNCAVRKIMFIKEINKEFYFCSIGAKKEIFLFKLNLDNITKPKFICISKISENISDKNQHKKTKDIIIENNVENSRNMDLCLLNLENNKFQISVTDTIDVTSIFSFDLNIENKSVIDNIYINKNNIRFISSNFIPLCMCYCTDKYLLYGQSNGVLRIYDCYNKQEKYFKLSEAGINEIKVYDISKDNKNIFLVFTCGEDCNLVISEFDIDKNEVKIINKIKNIHYSAIKSIDIIKYENNNILIISGGYDQIVNVSLFNLEKYTFKVLKYFHVCTSEINSIKGRIIKNEENNIYFLYIIIGGLGMEYLKFKIHG